MLFRSDSESVSMVNEGMPKACLGLAIQSVTKSMQRTLTTMLILSRKIEGEIDKGALVIIDSLLPMSESNSIDISIIEMSNQVRNGNSRCRYYPPVR